MHQDSPNPKKEGAANCLGAAFCVGLLGLILAGPAVGAVAGLEVVMAGALIALFRWGQRARDKGQWRHRERREKMQGWAELNLARKRVG